MVVIDVLSSFSVVAIFVVSVIIVLLAVAVVVVVIVVVRGAAVSVRQSLSESHGNFILD